MEVTPHNLIGRHPQEYFHVVSTKDILSTHQGNPSIVPDAGRSGVNLLFLLIPSPWPLMPGSKLLYRGVGDAIPTVPIVGVNGSAEEMGAPLSITRMALAPMADKGSSFLPLIRVYMSLLKFVVISVRGKHLLIYIQVYARELILTNLTLTLFSFNIDVARDVGRWVRA